MTVTTLLGAASQEQPGEYRRDPAERVSVRHHFSWPDRHSMVNKGNAMPPAARSSPHIPLTRFLNKAEVLTLTALTSRTLDRLESQDAFPRRRMLSPRKRGWLSTEIQAWIAARPCR